MFESGHKWWAIEVRFDRPLTASEVRLAGRILRGSYGDPLIEHVGVDGFTGKLDEKWPGQATFDLIRRAVRGLPGARMRATYHGQHCPGVPECDCELALSGDRTMLSNAACCAGDIKRVPWVDLTTNR